MSDQINEYKAAISSHILSGNVASFQNTIGTLFADLNLIQTSKAVLFYASEMLHEEIKLSIKDDPSLHMDEEKLINAVNFILSGISNHPMRLQFEDVDYKCRESLFSYHCACGEFKTAALILSEVNIESIVCKFSSDQKADLLIRCAEAFLHDSENSAAETVLNRARTYMTEIETSLSSSRLGSNSQHNGQIPTSSLLQLRYRVTRAKVEDSNRKFVEAARLYYDLSNVAHTSIPANEKLLLLGNAVTCAVLAKAGPQRSRLLGILCKDDRLKELDHLPKFASHASVITKMYTERLLSHSELNSFKDSLAEHQKATTSDGRSIVDRAVIEHNLLATGKIYDNVSFSELSSILHLNPVEAEAVAAKMISENRLCASIDQTEGILSFEVGVSNHLDNLPLTYWDNSIREICVDVSDLVDKIVANNSVPMS